MFNTPYGIFRYEINTLCSYIAYQTNTPLHHIKQKAQISYLANYFDRLKAEHLDQSEIFFIHENEYIDKYYLEDYAEYYVRCFQNYVKNCSRIHFFKLEKDFSSSEDSTKDKKINELIKNEFHLALSGETSIINSDNYLGYIVIRPIPQTFLAKVCLKPYYQNKKTDRLDKFIIAKSYQVSLFGIDLKIETVAQQEQDKVLAACATSALWSFFHAHPNLSIKHLPSSSAITKNAYPEHNGHDREFPNSGLSTEMICRSLRFNGLSPKYFEFFKEETDKKLALHSLKEHIFAYCSSKLPIILGVTIKDTEEKVDKGLHAVTILGYSLDETVTTSTAATKSLSNINLVSQQLQNLYVHDDRIGPFTKIEFDNEDNNWTVSIDKNNAVTEIENHKTEIYVSDTLIIGLYHKVRISYASIKDTCSELSSLLTSYLRPKGENSAKYAEAIEAFLWDIQLKKVSELKKWILSDSTIKNKEKYVTTSWPKYIWSARVSLEGIDIFELLFDATDIEQGNVFLDILPLNEEMATSFIQMLKGYCSDHFNFRIKKDDISRTPNNHIWGIIDYFNKKTSFADNLNHLFGNIRIPKKIKETEVNEDTIISQCEVRYDGTETADFSLDSELKGCSYIWVIDTDGFLCIGQEPDGSQQGHPTLTDGKPARIGGELHYQSGIWRVDPFSGRYSSDYSEDEKKQLIDNVIKYRFNVFLPHQQFQTQLEKVNNQ